MNRNREERSISETKSVCPECGAVIAARIVEREDGAYMKKTCPEHGDFDLRIHDNPVFLRKCLEGTSPTPDEILHCDMAGCITCGRHLDYVKTIVIDVTERCNLNCTACFTNANSRASREPSIDEITSRLSLLKHRPGIQLFGGEPTLRKDLPEIIHAITSLGFTVKLASNGINLADAGYARELRAAGLEWVLLQFDGFSDDIYKITRGRELADIKKQAVDALSAAEIKICLVCMVVKGVNDGALGALVDYMMERDAVMQVGCVVLSTVGRNGFEPECATTAFDVLTALERETHGRVRVEDFMRFRAVANGLFKLTGKRDFQQKSCFHTLMLHGRGARGYVPVTRYLTPGGAILNLPGLVQFCAAVMKNRKWDTIRPTSKIKLITVEEFRGHDTIDLMEANRCNKVYMAGRGYIPACIYNTMYRPLCWLGEGTESREAAARP